MPLSGPATAALSTTEFIDFMRAAGPFPGDTAVAVAVSGGADSMTLLALARDWAAKSGARLTALTVDHCLRPESGAEAVQVAAWCVSHGIAHETLVWAGEKPDKGIQAAARTARYSLLEDWCRAHGHTELLVAHSQNDQAETFLMRMSRGSGIDGLAAMPLVSCRDGVRLIRPLLGVPRSRIEVTAAARSLETVSDPSNLDRRYARIRMRDKLKLLEAHGVSVSAIAGTARVFGNMRAARERATAGLAGEIAVLQAEGYARISRDGLAAGDTEAARGLMAAVLTSVGGLDYPPRRERLDRLMVHVLEAGDFRPRTLGNCVISAHGSAQGEDVQIRREYRTIRHVIPVVAGRRVVWDGRFTIQFAQDPAIGDAGYRLGALGEDGWRHIVSVSDRENLTEYRGIPGPVRYALPAIWQGEKVVEVPHLRYQSDQVIEKIVENVEFRPQQPLNGHLFWVA
ncbi:MAG: tRNA(Ile)-lysidine synthase [Paracoccaceae bacterium]